jgi:hypothetical protein
MLLTKTPERNDLFRSSIGEQRFLCQPVGRDTLHGGMGDAVHWVEVNCQNFHFGFSGTFCGFSTSSKRIGMAVKKNAPCVLASSQLGLYLEKNYMYKFRKIG